MKSKHLYNIPPRFHLPGFMDSATEDANALNSFERHSKSRVVQRSPRGVSKFTCALREKERRERGLAKTTKETRGISD